MQDGAKLAAEGITVVTVNFRLGRFGFLALPELSAESGHQASGNYGIMDQVSRWSLHSPFSHASAARLLYGVYSTSPTPPNSRIPV